MRLQSRSESTLQRPAPLLPPQSWHTLFPAKMCPSRRMFTYFCPQIRRSNVNMSSNSSSIVVSFSAAYIIQRYIRIDSFPCQRSKLVWKSNQPFKPVYQPWLLMSPRWYSMPWRGVLLGSLKKNRGKPSCRRSQPNLPLMLSRFATARLSAKQKAIDLSFYLLFGKSVFSLSLCNFWMYRMEFT